MGKHSGVDLAIDVGIDVGIEVEARRVVVRGELDGAAGPLLAEAGDVLASVNVGDIEVDVDGVSFLDAGGLGCLVRLNNQLREVGARLSVVGATPRVRHLFGITGLAGLLATHPQKDPRVERAVVSPALEPWR